MAAAGREVQRLSRVVDGLLTLNRAEGTGPGPRPVDVDEVIEDRCEAWSALADERRLHLHAEFPSDDHPLAMLVPGDLDQILDNLLANAVDASPAGGRIRVRRAAPDAGSMELHVIDEGPWHGRGGPPAGLRSILAGARRRPGATAGWAWRSCASWRYATTHPSSCDRPRRPGWTWWSAWPP